VLVDPWLRDWDAPVDLDRCGYLGSERDGGFAEDVSVQARNVHPIESTPSDVELASFATASITAANMLDRAGRRGRRELWPSLLSKFGDAAVSGLSGGRAPL
jgi:NADPH:quinone reductase-like Zn-dependent oxidoreductase